MKQKFVKNFGILLIVFAILISILTFYFSGSSVFEPISITLIALFSGGLFAFLYFRAARNKKINGLVKSSVVIGIIATLVFLLFLVVALVNPTTESYGSTIYFYIGIAVSGAIYGMSLVLLIIDWFLNINKN